MVGILNEGCPRFVARFNVPSGFPPARFYLHQAGLHEAFGSQNPVGEAGRYVLDVLIAMRRMGMGGKYDFVIAMAYGDIQHQKSADLFGFICPPSLPGNTDVEPWVCRNGVFVPEGIVTCGDSLIVLGQEEAHRRTCKDLADFLRNPPEINVEGRENIEERTLSLWA